MKTKNAKKEEYVKIRKGADPYDLHNWETKLYTEAEARFARRLGCVVIRLG